MMKTIGNTEKAGKEVGEGRGVDGRCVRQQCDEGFGVKEAQAEGSGWGDGLGGGEGRRKETVMMYSLLGAVTSRYVSHRVYHSSVAVFLYS